MICGLEQLHRDPCSPPPWNKPSAHSPPALFPAVTPQPHQPLFNPCTCSCGVDCTHSASMENVKFWIRHVRQNSTSCCSIKCDLSSGSIVIVCCQLTSRPVGVQVGSFLFPSVVLRPCYRCLKTFVVWSTFKEMDTGTRKPWLEALWFFCDSFPASMVFSCLWGCSSLFFLSVPTITLYLNLSRRARPSSACSLPRSTCWSWFCTEGTSWTQVEGTRTASRRTSTLLAQLLTQSCVFTTLLRWDASPSAWCPALPSVPRPSPWCPSKGTHMLNIISAACKYCW